MPEDSSLSRIQGAGAAAQPGRRPILVVVGEPGLRRKHVGDKCAGMLAIPHVQTGDAFKEWMIQHNEGKRRVRDFFAKAEEEAEPGEDPTKSVLPSKFILEALEWRLNKPDMQEGFILTGFPQTYEEAEELDNLLLKTEDIIAEAVHLQKRKKPLTLQEVLDGEQDESQV